MLSNNVFQYVRDYDSFEELFAKESDRAAAVLAASYLDGILEAAVLEIMPNHQPAKDLLTEAGPLGSFGAKANLLYALGKITERDWKDLKVIRKTRNKFAHSTEDYKFDQLPVKDWCGELSIMHTDKFWDRAQKKEVMASPRLQFMMGAGVVAFSIIHDCIYSKKRVALQH